MLRPERTIVGIYRETALSPGKVEADAAILNEVLAGLETAGWKTLTLSADDLPQRPPAARGVLHLAQGPEALKRLIAWEAAGLRLINSPQAVRRCYRRFLPPIMAKAGVPYPETRLYGRLQAEADFPREFPGPGWLKRAEIHAEGPGDVRLVHTLGEAWEVLGDFRARGIDALVWQEHLAGREIKFYGVGPGRFFWAAAADGEADLPQAERARLASLAVKAAGAVELTVFGGDAILTPEGNPVLIDLNDWPSFSRCREAAAKEIVAHVLDTFAD
jgi:hypothetical protein